MIDLATTYLGFDLKSPIVASSSPLCDTVDGIRRLEDAGVAAVILPSLFEEQIELETRANESAMSRGSESFAESLNYLPNLLTYNTGPQGYLELIHSAKAAVDIPVIASLNGVSSGGWTQHAREMEQAGASAIELNIYSIPVDARRSGTNVELGYVDLVRRVRQTVSVPLAVKLPNLLTAPANLAKQLDEVGVDGLVLFNRFYQPDFDVDALELVPTLSLSSPQELLLRLHWVAILFRQVRADLAVTGGVHSGKDVLKAMMAGANVAMMASALLKYGVGHVVVVLEEIRHWMEEHEYESIGQMCGSLSRRSAPNAGALERGNYMRVLSSYTLRSAVSQMA